VIARNFEEVPMPDEQRRDKQNADAPEGNSPTGIAPEDVIAGNDDEDPVSEAYGRTDRPGTTGISGIPASDEDAGAERRRLYEQGAEIVSRID
jgi:hypothetical protein